MIGDLKPRKYRIVLHNLPAEQKTIETIVKEELGDVRVADWSIEREIEYTQAACYAGSLSHRDIIISLTYHEQIKSSSSGNWQSKPHIPGY